MRGRIANIFLPDDFPKQRVGFSYLICLTSNSPIVRSLIVSATDSPNYTNLLILLSYSSLIYLIISRLWRFEECHVDISIMKCLYSSICSMIWNYIARIRQTKVDYLVEELKAKTSGFVARVEVDHRCGASLYNWQWRPRSNISWQSRPPLQTPGTAAATVQWGSQCTAPSGSCHTTPRPPHSTTGTVSLWTMWNIVTKYRENAHRVNPKRPL